MSNNSKHTGKVKFFNTGKSFGFIKDDAGGEVFMHVSQIKTQDELREGDEVTFTVEEGKKGMQAVNVQSAA